MADTTRLWEDPSTGEVTLEVINSFGDWTERYAIDRRQIPSWLLTKLNATGGNTDKMLNVLRQNATAKGVKMSRPAGPTPPPSVPWAGAPAPVGYAPPSSSTSTAPSPAPNGGNTVPDAKTPPKERSCLDCTNYLAAKDVPKRYAKAVGTAMCSYFDKPLGRAGDSENEHKMKMKKVGTPCNAFGKEANGRPSRTFKIAFPDLTRMDQDKLDADLKSACSSCTSCQNFTPDDIVISELGWVAGLCNAKGELVPPHSTTYVGRTCEVKQFGEPRRSATIGLNLFPEYTDDFLTGDLIEEFRKANAFDPLAVETDKPVSDEDRAHGIRAWSQIIDKERPDHKTGIFLPVFDPAFFDDAERSKIPQTGDDEHPELYVDHANAVYKTAVCWTELDDTPAVWGEAGNGKTELGRYLAWRMQLPFERISITASTELDDLAGKYHFEKDRGTYFQMGRLPKAWSKPCVIVLDEPNVGQNDVWQFIRPLTDNSKQLVLDMAEGQRIRRNDDCYMMMALNPAWDARNVGANPIGDADQRRLMHIFMPPPPREVEEEIIRQRCAIDKYDIPKAVLNAVMTTAADLRGLSEQQAIPITWGVAPNIKVARATKFFGLIDAYKIAVTDYLEPSQAEAVLQAVRTNAPSSLIGGARSSIHNASPWR